MREPVKVIGDILKSELSLEDGQIMLANQLWDVPPTQGLYIALSYISSKAIGSNNYYDSDLDQEVQEITMHHLIQIDALSADSSARTRKEEILMALRSMYSEEQQGLNRLQIARIAGDFINASDLEATVRLQRFITTIAVTALSRKVKGATFYDDFSASGEFVENQQTTPTPFEPVDSFQ